MGEITFESAIDSRNRKTRLSIDTDLASIKSIQLIDTTGGGSTTLTTIASSPISLFVIRFTKYDLAGTPNKRLPGAVEYKITQSKAPSSTTSGSGFLTLSYEGVPAQLVEGMTGTFDAINVSITFKAPTASADLGWIDLDIKYTYPSQMNSGNASAAWETRLVYPQVCLSDASVEGYTILNPLGVMGNFKTLGSRWSGHPTTVQFAALYKTSKVNGIDRADGFALSATDERGNFKEFHYAPLGNGTRFLAYNLLSPIHLKEGKFARPSDYTLSLGDNYDFGGAGMHFRIRAFRVEAACKDQVVDWFDVLSIYRDWVRTRTSTIYRRFITNREKSAPLDLMHPHTIISNYSLDGPIGKFEGDAKLRRSLEVHPMVNGSPDMPDNDNHSIQKVLLDLKDKFGIADMKLEAQIWGFEMGGFYHFTGGFPPVTDVLVSAGRFKSAMDQLVAAKIIPIITTDPLSTYFNRERFRGHLLFKDGSWKDAIPDDFPDNFKAITCANTEVTGNNRCFHVVPSAASDTPNCSTAQILGRSVKRGADGNLLISQDALTRFHAAENRLICPTEEVENLYLTTWLKTELLGRGVKLIEFMKHGQRVYFCFDKNHRHIVPAIQNGLYDNVIGYGSWYVRRVQRIWEQTQTLGRTTLNIPYFTLTNEGAASEALVPYYDEYYDHFTSSILTYSMDTRSMQSLDDVGMERRVPVYHYVYSAVVGHKMNLVDSDFQIHVGYKEKRNGSGRVSPTFMLQASRDSEDPTFNKWKTESANYFTSNFTIEKPGIAPAGYTTNQLGDYTYRRSVQGVFNLRSQIFRFGVAAVYGERILVPSTWAEEPADFNDEAVNMAVRATHFHIRFNEFFREQGTMLGQTKIFTGNSTLRAWRAHYRNFTDVAVLVNKLYNQTEITDLCNNKVVDDPKYGMVLYDYISRGVDTQTITPLHCPDKYSAEEKRVSRKITTEKIHHMVWQRNMGGNNKRYLYAFANVGNASQPVSFLYSRGLEDGQPWNTQIFTFRGNPTGQPVNGPSATLGMRGNVTIPERSIVAILVSK